MGKVMTTEQEIEENKKVSFAKRIAGRFAHKTWPQLIVVKEKHDNGYYLVNDVEAVWRWALAILKERLDQRWYYKPDEPKLREEVPDDVMDKLPESLRKKAKDDKQSNKSNMKRYQRDMEVWNDIHTALTEQNGALAFKVLDDRKDHEYEGFTFETLEVP